MSRLQKKCFFGATGLHGLLLLALLIGPGFIKQPKLDNAPMIEIVPMVVDDQRTGGGTPPPAPAVPQQPVVQQPQPTPPPPRSEPVQRPQPTPPRAEPAKTEPPRVVRKDAEPAPQPPRHQVQVSQRVVNLANNRTTPTRTPIPPTTAPANNEVQQALSRAQERLRAGLSSSTRVEMPEGVGGGGVSYASYGQIVRLRYSEAWMVPADMTDDEATIKVSVTVARDGKVLDARITQPSASAAANRSIQNTLDRIREIGRPFPEGAKESQRTFIMTFNLKAKKAFG
jgi:TonB family protein